VRGGANHLVYIKLVVRPSTLQPNACPRPKRSVINEYRQLFWHSRSSLFQRFCDAGSDCLGASRLSTARAASSMLRCVISAYDRLLFHCVIGLSNSGEAGS
jgi:hypothetical protein